MRLQEYITEMIDIEKHLRDRGIDPDRTKVFMDKDKGIAIFLLYNLSGKLVGYQQYNPKGKKGINYSDKSGKNLDKKDLMKYYTYVTKENDKTKQIAVYGLETYDKNSKYLYVVEGLFDAVKLHRQGLPAIAVLANDPKPFREWFKLLPQKIIVILDNDENLSGNKLAKFGDKVLQVPNPYKDLGDMKDKEVKKFLLDNGVKV